MKTKMNVKLLRRIQREIRAEPLRMDMDRWAYCDVTAASLGRKLPPCGAVGCVAGWAVMLTVKEEFAKTAFRVWSKRNTNVIEKARKLLRLEISEAMRLFYPDEWPKPFNRIIHMKDGTPRYAELVCKRIDHFIKTKGAE